ncbi:hypothetical protein V1512DRAFT_258262 [Lipomyces arxii]|uniref:uncharacterized protein n=1 Tax=Lipomyces arxii TaxID=56418 RepID=UPI0034CDC4DE
MAPGLLGYMLFGTFVRFFHIGLGKRTIQSDGIPNFLFMTGVYATAFGFAGLGINKIAESAQAKKTKATEL